MPPTIETLDGRRLSLADYAAERCIVPLGVYRVTEPAGRGLRRERPRLPLRRVTCLTLDGRLIPLMDYAEELRVSTQALVMRRDTYRRADDVWVIGKAGRPGRKREVA